MLLGWLGLWPVVGLADQTCIECHVGYATEMAGKPAQAIDCLQCHTKLDGSVLPHRSSTGFSKGLPDTPATSCQVCHRKEAYSKLVHGTLGGGCTGCHATHSPQHGKPRADGVADLCGRCHPRASLVGRITHKPVASGDCADCHEMHASEYRGLLSNPPGELCAACHRKVKRMPHGVETMPAEHPVGADERHVVDPSQPNRPYECTSCHDPHRSGRDKLLKFDLRDPTGFCFRCHPL